MKTNTITLPNGFDHAPATHSSPPKFSAHSLTRDVHDATLGVLGMCLADGIGFITDGFNQARVIASATRHVDALRYRPHAQKVVWCRAGCFEKLWRTYHTLWWIWATSISTAPIM